MEERSKSYYDTSYLRNSEFFLGSLSIFPLKVILHGHKHDNFEKRMIINDAIREKEKIATVLSSGSLAKKDLARNYFRHLEIFSPDSPLELLNTTYQYEKYAFKPQPEIRIPMQKASSVQFRLDYLFQSETALYNAYQDLKEKDTVTAADQILQIFDHTIGAL